MGEKRGERGGKERGGEKGERRGKEGEEGETERKEGDNSPELKNTGEDTITSTTRVQFFFHMGWEVILFPYRLGAPWEQGQENV